MSWASHFEGANLSAFAYSASLLALLAAKLGTGGFVAKPDWIFDGTPAYFYLFFGGEGPFSSLDKILGSLTSSFEVAIGICFREELDLALD